LLYSGIFLYSCFVLLIGKLLEETTFDNAFETFVLGLPIVCVILMTLKDNRKKLLIESINHLGSGAIVEKQIRCFIELVDNKEKDRQSLIILKGYIYLHVKSCNLSDCYLKTYMEEIAQNKDSVALLYQHAKWMFQFGISKFPNCIFLRMSYAFFLRERMKNKKQCLMELINAEQHGPTFDQQFNIYRYKKNLEQQDDEDGEEESNLDVVANMAYNNYFTQFVEGIKKASQLYIEFWSLLLNQDESQEDLTKLNDIGTKINLIVEQVGRFWDDMQKLKYNDKEVIGIYAEFLYEILNEKERGKQLKKRLFEMGALDEDNQQLSNKMFEEDNYVPNTDEIQYMVLSADSSKIGDIIKVSLGMCKIFGYSRNDLLGHNINMLIPDNVGNIHKKVLEAKILDHAKKVAETKHHIINKYKKLMMQSGFTGSTSGAISQSHHKDSSNLSGTHGNNKIKFREISVYGKNKSRYLVPLSLRVGLMPSTSKNDNYFVAKLIQEENTYNNPFMIKSSNKVCYVLTDPTLIIQNYSANAINILGIGKFNNNHIDISKFIKELHDELTAYEIEDKNPERISALRRNLLQTKYKSATKVRWRIPVIDTNKKGAESFLLSNLADAYNKQPQVMLTPGPKRTANLQGKIYENFILTIQEMNMLGNPEAYVFKFETPTAKEDYSFVPRESHASLHFDNKDEIVKVDSDFLPDKTPNFYMDSKQMQYLINPSSKEQLSTNLHNQVIAKLKKYREEETPLNESLDSVPEVEEEKKEEKVEQKEEITDYYHVDMKSIKYLIYDHRKNAIIEVGKTEEFLDQMEFKKRENQEKFKDTESKAASISPKKHADFKTLEDMIDKENDSENLNYETILIKQIEYALGKEETPVEIARLTWIGRIVFLFLVALTIVFFYFFLTTRTQIQNNLNVVFYSFQLITNSIMGLFYTRELVLLNNPNYTGFGQDKSIYVKNITENLNQLFTNTYTLFSDINNAGLVYSEATNEILNKQYISINSLNNEKTNLLFSNAFVETTTVLYHISKSDLKEVVNDNSDVYFYIYNTYNSIIDVLFTRANTYVTEITGFKSHTTSLFNFTLIALVFVCIISAILIYIAFSSIVKRKESYLEVFFEIGDDTIEKSLNKCEEYYRLIQKETVSQDINDGIYLSEGNDNESRAHTNEQVLHSKD
jgi:PAS domain S-box-containing protein